MSANTTLPNQSPELAPSPGASAQQCEHGRTIGAHCSKCNPNLKYGPVGSRAPSGADTNAKPSSDDMRLAAEWLGEYEDGKEGDACKRVAAWLSEQADAKDLRDAAREHGVPVKALRKKIAALPSSSSSAPPTNASESVAGRSE